VGHSVGAFDPIAEIDVGQSGARGADDMVENDIGAEALSSVGPDVDEAIDHAETIGLLVAEAGANQPSRAAVHGRLAILDDVCPDRRLLDHVGKVALVHFGHAAARVAHREIAAEQLVLLVGSPRLARANLEVGIAAEDLALGGAGLELGGKDPHGDAGRTFDAAWAIGDGLAAAEADAPERLVELARVAAA